MSKAGCQCCYGSRQDTSPSLLPVYRHNTIKRQPCCLPGRQQWFGGLTAAVVRVVWRSRALTGRMKQHNTMPQAPLINTPPPPSTRPPPLHCCTLPAGVLQVNTDLASPAPFKLTHSRPGTVSLSLSDNDEDPKVRERSDYRCAGCTGLLIGWEGQGRMLSLSDNDEDPKVRQRLDCRCAGLHRVAAWVLRQERGEEGGYKETNLQFHARLQDGSAACGEECRRADVSAGLCVACSGKLRQPEVPSVMAACTQPSCEVRVVPTPLPLLLLWCAVLCAGRLSS